VESCTATPNAHADGNIDGHAKPPPHRGTYRLEGNEEAKKNRDGGVEVFWVKPYIFCEVAGLIGYVSNVIGAWS
jgi:hypothetical protein